MHRLALGLAFAGGGALSVQAFVNGRLAESLGSALLAGTINNAIGLAALLAVAAAIGALGRARRRLRVVGRPRVWQLVAGANGALFIVVSATAAPEVGIALLTVALVCGQMGGGLVVDRFGLTPAGRRALTPARVLAVALTISAVALAALGARGDPQLLLLALAVLAGAGIAVQQAAVAHVARVTGEPVVAAAVNFLAGALVVTAVTAALADLPAGSWSAAPGEWIGGLLGAAVAVLLARVVAVLGALRAVLAVVAGQSVGGLVIDLVAPVPGEAVRLGTVVGVALTIAAVAVSGRGAPASRGPAAAQPAGA